MTNEEKLNEYFDLKNDLEDLIDSIVVEADVSYLGDLRELRLIYSGNESWVECFYEYIDPYDGILDNQSVLKFPVELLDQTQTEWEAWWKKQEEKSEQESYKEELNTALLQASYQEDIVKKAVEEGVLGELSSNNERLEFINKYLKERG